MNGSKSTGYMYLWLRRTLYLLRTYLAAMAAFALCGLAGGYAVYFEGWNYTATLVLSVVVGFISALALSKRLSTIAVPAAPRFFAALQLQQLVVAGTFATIIISGPIPPDQGVANVDKLAVFCRIFTRPIAFAAHNQYCR